MDMQIQLSAATFARLQKLAIPLVDSIESVIGRLIDNYERLDSTQGSQTQSLNHFGPEHVKSFDCAFPPKLKHTKVLAAKLKGIIPLTQVRGYANLRTIGDSNAPQA